MNRTEQPRYLSCYGLSKAPFTLSPDPGFFFPSAAHRSVKAVLKYAIEGGEGFMALIGEAGTGKTLLLRMLLLEIGDRKRTAVILCPSLSPVGLLQIILRELGETVPETSETAILYSIFQARLMAAEEFDKEVLIVVDEAQNLPIETMEQLRMLSNIELDDRKLLQVLIVGQPSLVGLLRHPRLGQLTQRITVYEHLRPLTFKETVEYVGFRLAKAGRTDLLLSGRAQKTLFRETGGIPRLINRLMDRALIFANADNAADVGAKHLQRAAETLPERSLYPSRRNGWRWAVGLAAAVAVGVALVALYAPTKNWLIAAEPRPGKTAAKVEIESGQGQSAVQQQIRIFEVVVVSGKIKQL